MTKLEYLCKVFANTKGKTFENYVINQIWAKVEKFGLYPVTQQYVKRKKGYALLDLYFPQINYAIEVDELPYHDKIIKADEMRTEDIFSSVQGIKLKRVRENSYKILQTQINVIAKDIESIIKKAGHLSWEEDWQEKEYQSKLAIIKQRKKLLVSDNIKFKRINITNDLFNMGFSEGHLQYGKSFFKKTDNETIWFPHLTPQKDWDNSISDDWSIIKEKYIGNKILNSKKDDLLRLTFAKYKDTLGEVSYRFIGVFKMLKYQNKIRIYKRVSTEIEL